MATQRHTAVSASTTLFGAALNSLADGGYLGPSSAVNNDDSSTRYLFGMLELLVTFASSPTAGRTVDVYLMPTLDGTNYPEGGSGVAPSDSLYVGSFAVRAVGTAQRLILFNVPLPPTDFKVMIKNSSGQNFASSGNTLSLIMSGYEVA